MYRVSSGEVWATDGRLTAGHPWPHGGEFLVPGNELEKLLKRLPDDPTIRQDPEDGTVTLSSGRFRGTIRTSPLIEWRYPGVEDAKWRPLPPKLPEVLDALRNFISENAVQLWSMAVTLEDGWAYATNNITIASGRCPGTEGINALLPAWAVDFLLPRTEGLKQWCWTENYVGFKWKNGAWMRSQLIDSRFPERAAEMARSAHNETPSQEITKDFREAFSRISDLAQDAIHIYSDRIESSFGNANATQAIDLCEVPPNADCSTWGSKYLDPVIAYADSWQPRNWPKPTPWKGKLLAGYVMGRRQ